MTTEEQKRQFGRQICAVAAGYHLSRDEACEAYRQIILNEQPELQQGAFLMAHIARGPTVEELSGAWDALDRYDTAKVPTTVTGTVCDIVGTGSDALKTVNCSTPAAMIVAGCGIPVAKKGARLVTGVSGASDVLEILGLDLQAPLERAGQCLDRHGICYLPGEAFLRSGWARLIQSMRFTSAFNIIGPLTRPCAATNAIVIGAYQREVCDQLVAVLAEIGMESALAPYGMVQGQDPQLGMDEFSPCGPTRVTELRRGKQQTYTVTPEDFGIRPVDFGRIASRDDGKGNADALRETLQGQYDTPLADFFCINAAAALYATGHADSYAQGMDQARQALAQGAAWAKLQALIEVQGQR
jgi:anthranilate phosphoribosyltransferase